MFRCEVVTAAEILESDHRRASRDFGDTVVQERHAPFDGLGASRRAALASSALRAWSARRARSSGTAVLWFAPGHR